MPFATLAPVVTKLPPEMANPDPIPTEVPLPVTVADVLAYILIGAREDKSVAVAALMFQLPLAPVPIVLTRVLVPAGNVTFVVALDVIVVAYAPANVVTPASVNVLLPLFTPVPPNVGEISEPFHVPLASVPTAVMFA